MGNVTSRICSPSPPPPPQPSPPLTLSKSFTQRPFLLSKDPPTLRSPPSTSSPAFGGSLRTRADGRSTSSSHVGRVLPSSLSLHRQRSVSEKRLWPNSEQLIAQEFGIQPGATKLLSSLTSGESGRASPPPPQEVLLSGRWVLGGEIPSPGLHMGDQLGGGLGSLRGGKPRRWSLKELSSSTRRRVGGGEEDGRSREEQARTLPGEGLRMTEVAGRSSRFRIPPRSSSLAEMEQRWAKMEQTDG